MIKLLLIGHLGKDAEQKSLQSGDNVTNFNVASSESWKDAKGEKRNKTTWIECSWWGDHSNVAPYLKKGTQVFVEGNVEAKTYPKNDGTTGVSLTCRVLAVQLLGGSQNGKTEQEEQPKAQQQQPQAQPTKQPQQKAEDITEPIDDLPF